MSESAQPPDHVRPDHVPTLTEVVRVASARPASEPGDSALAALDEAQIVNRVLATLQRQIEPVLDRQLRAAIAPALARAAELLVHELRLELARTLRDVVARAVAQELAETLAGSLAETLAREADREADRETDRETAPRDLR